MNIGFGLVIAIIVVLVILMLVFAKSKGVSRKFGSAASILLILSIVSVFISAIYAISFVIPSSDEGDGLEQNFTIEAYKVVLDIKDDYSVNVVEYLDVNMLFDGLHGIYRTIPSWLEYTNKDGKTNSRKAVISNIRVKEYEYEIEEVGHEKQKIKIGSQFSTIDAGLVHYEISYKYDMGGDIYKGFDEFIFHTFGDYWGTRINNPSIEINLPESTNLNNKIHFYDDKYRSNDISNYINYEIVGNTIYVNLDPSYELMKSLTVDIELPEHYFDSSVGINNTSLYGCFICIFIFFIILVLWFIHGKDYKVSHEMLNEDLLSKYDVAELAYLYNDQVGFKTIVALLIGLADKGVISIEDTDNENVYKITKTGKYDNTTDNEKAFLELLFKDKEEVFSNEVAKNYNLLSSMNNRMYVKFDNVINETKSYVYMFISSILVVLAVVLFIVFAFYIDDIEKKYLYWYFITLLAIAFSILLSFLMKRRNKYGEGIKNKIDYIKNNIENYGDIVAVAFAFGVLSVWATKYDNENKKLKKLYRTEDFVNRFSNSVYPTSSDGSSSGGCSSCGGGCSSCGGGGSW